MPQRRGYKKRGTRSRRRRLTTSTALVPIAQTRRSGALIAASRMARVHPAVHAAMNAYDAAQHATRIYNTIARGIGGNAATVRPLKTNVSCKTW